MESTSIYLEFGLDIEYNISGKEMPATQRDPAESPELEVTSVKLGNTEIMHEMCATDMQIITDQCWEHAQEGIDDEGSARGDALYEEAKDRRHGL